MPGSSHQQSSQFNTEPDQLRAAAVATLSVEPVQSAESTAAEQKSRESFFFPGLNQVRMVAALAVVVYHIERNKSLYGIDFNAYSVHAVKCLGPEGVRLFFVLSGFLISFLLVQEIKKNKTIAIKKFYIRRMLRIWPLYYLVVLNAFFVFPLVFQAAAGSYVAGLMSQLHHNFFEKLGLYLTFLPNLCLIKYPAVPAAGQCWSLGVEEQFYLIWPFLLCLFRRAVPLGILALLSLKPALIWCLDGILFRQQWHGNLALHRQLESINQMVSNFDVESFAAGAIAAYIMAKNPEQTKKIAGNPIFLVFAITGIALGFVYEFPQRDRIITAAFAFLVLALAQAPIKLGFINKPVDYLGVISYGLYMLHPLVVVTVIQACSKSGWIAANPLLGNLSIYAAVILLTAALATLSYEFFEKPFLRAKAKFASIKTGPQQ